MKQSANPRAVAAVVIAAAGLTFLTALLASGLIQPRHFCLLAPIVGLIAVAIYLAERLREFSLKDLSVKLDEIKQVRAEAVELYSKIEHLQQSTMKMDREVMEALGLGGGKLVTGSAVMRFTSGCIKRERERLARIFAEARAPATIAQAILDGRYDELVFKFNGPEVPLESPPVSVDERAARAAAKEGTETGQL
jgi:hypothetical protein